MALVDITRAFDREKTPQLADRVTGDVLDAPGSEVVAQLREILPAERILDSPLDIIRVATDASPYRLIPKCVVRPKDTEEIAALARWAARTGHGLTFRAAGTSLNGQSQSDDILVDVREFFRGIEVLDDGARVRTSPGAITARVNLVLSRYGRKLGPDPASSGAATVGGVLANNASGMTCGVKFNAYHTLDSVVIVLASGTVVDTGAEDADERLEQDEPALYKELLAIKASIGMDEELTSLLRRKFSIKNTSGYHLDAFLDADTPAQILAKLIVGSEGTLGFIASIVWNTVPFGRKHTTAFFRFPTLRDAAAAVPGLNDAGAQAVEILDAASIRSVSHVPHVPEWMQTLGAEATDAAILTELRADDPAELEAFEKKALEVVAGTKVSGDFTHDAGVSAGYWHARSGLLATVGAARPMGTALITEDVCVPPVDLADACEDLEELLVKHGFEGAVNGHASAGNVHFYLYLDSSDPENVKTYRAFMEDLVGLIADKYKGSLKGEHGTGRNMAPYIIREWGKSAVDAMWRVKRALDPKGILGPGVFLNEDPDITYKNLKTMPKVAPDLDPCIECGFCEPVCPSRHVTTTPRQRIALQRELARQGWDGDLEEKLVEEYEYAAVNMCAGDSSCAIACPVNIDTGHAMKRIRRDSFSETAQKGGLTTAKNWGKIVPLARTLLHTASVVRPILRDGGLTAITTAARSVLPKDLVPGWLDSMPKGAPKVPKTTRENADAVYFAACVNRMFGQSRNAPKGSQPTTHAMVALAARVGYHLWIPDDIGDDCCATIWQSKGLQAGNELMAARVTEDLYRWSDGGRLPIVCDAASCTLGIAHEVVDHLDEAHKQMHAALKIYDSTTWALENIVPKLPEHDKLPVAVVHPTCSMNTLGVSGDLKELAGEVATKVVVPVTSTCCASAGDRMFLHPELTESATQEEAAEVAQSGADVFLSGNRTCEVGMEHDTGEPYESVIVALERVTRGH
ncbi:MAG: FAD-binding oxidoreductase [Microbacteriaceae bacterium]|jgi:D-lactate dehydrogenase|nr:FAD-binding oxidoreductase [Microbacteriaceae bacterium]